MNNSSPPCYNANAMCVVLFAARGVASILSESSLFNFFYCLEWGKREIMRYTVVLLVFLLFLQVATGVKRKKRL